MSTWHNQLVSFPHPTLKEGKGLVYIEQFLGHAGCSMSCDWHDNAPFWYGNVSTAPTRVQLTAIVRCHMIITCKPHGMNLIGAQEFRNATSSSPRNHSMYTRPFPSLLEGGVWERDYSQLEPVKNLPSEMANLKSNSSSVEAIQFNKT